MDVQVYTPKIPLTKSEQSLSLRAETCVGGGQEWSVSGWMRSVNQVSPRPWGGFEDDHVKDCILDREPVSAGCSVGRGVHWVRVYR